MKKYRGLLIIIVSVAGLAGCASPGGKPELTESERQDKALQDMDFHPTVGRPITSGDITTFDGSGFSKDMHDVLSP